MKLSKRIALTIATIICSIVAIFAIAKTSTAQPQIELVNPVNSTIKTETIAQTFTELPVEINPETGLPNGKILLTIFFKHDQSKTVDVLLEELEDSGYWQAFPPEGVEVISWYVVMGIGQIATLAVPPDRLRAVNVALERTAWSAYRTEAYPSYDFSLIAQRLRGEIE